MTGETARDTASSVSWLERDYDKPERFPAPPDHPVINARGFFQIKDDHEGRCGWPGCGHERETLIATVKLFAKVTRS